MTWNPALFSSARNNWKTPGGFYGVLDEEFWFVADFAAAAATAKTMAYYGLDHPDPTRRDGLAADWYAELCRLGGGSGFCNMPYGRGVTEMWMRKAYEEGLKGATVVCLPPARTGSRWFHEYAMKGEVRFIDGRLKFDDGPGCAPFDSMVVIFGPRARAGTMSSMSVRPVRKH